MDELQTALTILLLTLVLDLERRVSKLETLIQKVFNNTKCKDNNG